MTNKVKEDGFKLNSSIVLDLLDSDPNVVDEVPENCCCHSATDDIAFEPAMCFSGFPLSSLSI